MSTARAVMYVEPSHATIVHKPKDDSFRLSQTPYLLLRDDGKVRSFGSYREARDEAQKLYPNCRFRRP